MKNADRYSDIINLPHHQSATRPRMSNYDRAAQFSPFAALKGYEEEIEEAQRTAEAKKELTGEQIAELNEQLVCLKSKEKERPLVKIVYYEPNSGKQEGGYFTIVGNLKQINEYNQKIVLDTVEIGFNNIYSVEPM